MLFHPLTLKKVIGITHPRHQIQRKNGTLLSLCKLIYVIFHLLFLLISLLEHAVKDVAVLYPSTSITKEDDLMLSPNEVSDCTSQTIFEDQISDETTCGISEDNSTFCRLCLEESNQYLSLFENNMTEVLEQLTSIKVKILNIDR